MHCNSFCATALADDFAQLQKLTSRRLASLAALLEGRRQLEADMDRCLHWLNEAEVAISAEIRATNLELLQEQLTKVAGPLYPLTKG